MKEAEQMKRKCDYVARNLRKFMQSELFIQLRWLAGIMKDRAI